MGHGRAAVTHVGLAVAAWRRTKGGATPERGTRKEGAWGGAALGKHVSGRRVHWHMFDNVTGGGGHI